MASKIFEYLKGKKTYVTAILYAVAAVLDETGTFHIPEMVFQILGAIGLISLRAGVTKNGR